MHSHRESLQIVIGLPTLVLDILRRKSLGLAAMISIPDFESKKPSGVTICRLPPFGQFQIPETSPAFRDCVREHLIKSSQGI
jgi:hypothetical protein